MGAEYNFMSSSPRHRYRTLGHWSVCAVRRGPLRSNFPWADAIADWRGRNPLDIFRRLVGSWVAFQKASLNWSRLTVAVIQALYVWRGRSPARIARKGRVMDSRERWVRLAVHVHTYKYNLCLLTLHERPIFSPGWHLASRTASRSAQHRSRFP